MLRTASLALAVAASALSASAHETQCYECGGAVLPSPAGRASALDSRLDRLDYAARMRRLQGEIAYTEAAIASLRRIQGEYSRVNRFGTGNALTLSAEQVRLELLREELLLRDLREQVLIEQRLRRETRRHGAAAPVYATQRVTAHVPIVPAGEPTITITNHHD